MSIQMLHLTAAASNITKRSTPHPPSRQVSRIVRLRRTSQVDMATLPRFPYHRDPVASGSYRESDVPCECCGQARGILYNGVVYAFKKPKSLCPWCIADGSASDKYDASFFDAYFCDGEFEPIELPAEYRRAVFGCTIGFATFNPIGWWVHCGEPAEYVTRDEPYDMVFECRKCAQRQIIPDLD